MHLVDVVYLLYILGRYLNTLFHHIYIYIYEFSFPLFGVLYLVLVLYFGSIASFYIFGLYVLWSQSFHKIGFSFHIYTLLHIKKKERKTEFLFPSSQFGCLISLILLSEPFIRFV